MCVLKCAYKCQPTLALAFKSEFLYFAEAEALHEAEKADRKTMDSAEIQSLLYREEHKPLVRFISYLLRHRLYLKSEKQKKNNITPR